MTESNSLVALALSQTPDLDSRTLNRLWSLCRGRGACLADLRTLDEETLVTDWGLIPTHAKAVRHSADQDIGALRALLSGVGASHCWVGDDIYPARIQKRLGDEAPFVIFGSGDWSLSAARTVAISGSRDATPAGLEAAASWAEAIVARGLTLITGLAPGVDRAATHTALASGGSIIGILPEGMLTPRASKWVATAPPRGWLAISEHATAPWNAGLQTRRNQLIVALADAVILVEASEDGGTMQQAEDTESLGVPLGVIDLPAPGNRILLGMGRRGLPAEPDDASITALLKPLT